MAEQDACNFLADDAPLEPEKVQVVALLARAMSGAAVGAGAAKGWTIGEAKTDAAKAASRVHVRGSMIDEELCK